ncbi:SDR family NAD(P)-dependent oxidoreductase [Agrobacterium genomosp. 3 str. RTP8]|nr:SDR family NAD(P)-dependent oxidoreductase [Agrobacterium tomkonis RTP8]
MSSIHTSSTAISRVKSAFACGFSSAAFEVNVGPAILVRAPVPLMIGRGGASIVNLSSESRRGAFGQSNYSSAKSGLVGLTCTVAIEQARHGIRVNAVARRHPDTNGGSRSRRYSQRLAGEHSAEA